MVNARREVNSFYTNFRVDLFFFVQSWPRTHFFLHKLLKKENPNSKVIQSNDLNQTAENDQVWALRDINLDISKVSSDENQSIQSDYRPLLVVLEKDNQFIYEGNFYKMSFLEELIRKQIENDQDRSIIVSNKKGVTVQSLIEAIDSVKNAGGYNVSIVQGSG